MIAGDLRHLLDSYNRDKEESMGDFAHLLHTQKKMVICILRKLGGKQKVLIVIESFTATHISELYRGHEVSEAQFQRWKDN